MSQIMKAFTGIFVVLFMFLCSAGILSLFTQKVYAQNLHAAMVNELENSDYARSVLSDCFSSAKKHGYDLKVTLYGRDHKVIECTDLEQIPLYYSTPETVKVCLSYPLEVSFLGIRITQEEVAYGR